MPRILVLVVALLPFALSCASDGAGLRVDLRTDFVPGFEFAEVRTELSRLPRTGGVQDVVDRVDRRVTASDDVFAAGSRVAEFAKLNGEYWIFVELLTEDGELLADRPVRVDVSDEEGIVVVITRDCAGVECPSEGGDAASIACLAGECVDPRCRPGAIDFCGGSVGCGVDADCDAFADCAEPRCIDGTCFASADRGSCGEEEWCHPDLGCVDEGTGTLPPECRRVECVLPNECEIGLLSCGEERRCEPAGLVFTGRDCESGVCSDEGECRGYLVEASVSGPGVLVSAPSGIVCGEECAASFDRGTALTIEAIPNEGARLVSFDGECDVDENRCSFESLDGPQILAAEFERREHVVAVTVLGDGDGVVAGAGTIDCGVTCTTTLRYGDPVTLVAAPMEGMTFAGWGGDTCSGAGSTCEFVVRGDTFVTATFTIGTDNLSVERAGDGSGTVTSTPGPIECEPTCVGSFDRGAAVELIATAHAGSRFVRWTGDCTGTTSECTVVVSGPRSVVAEFERVRHTLTVERGVGGIVQSIPSDVIDCGATCAAEISEGDSVQLVAIPDPGFTFSGWSDPRCGGTGTCTVMIDRPTTITATFLPDPYRLMVNFDGLGSGRVISTPMGVDCDTPCSGLFPPGTIVSLSPVAADGSVFVGFTGDCAGTECEVTMDAARGVVANFALGYPLNVTFEGLGPPGEEGTGSVEISVDGVPTRTCTDDCTLMVREGAMISIDQTADEPYVRGGFSGACRTIPCELAMTEERNVTALFNTTRTVCWVRTGDQAGLGLNLGTTYGPREPCEVGGSDGLSARVGYGTVASFRALPDDGTLFLGYSGTTCSGTEPLCNVTMDRDHEVVLGFERAPRSIRVDAVGPYTEVTSSPAGIRLPTTRTRAAIFPLGAVVELTVSGAPSAAWTGACEGTGLSCSLVVTEAPQDVTVTLPRP